VGSQPTYRGISMILVEAERPGLTTADVGEKMGIHMMATAEVNYKDVRVPASNLIGQEGRGFYQVLEFFDESRILVAAQALGIAQGAFDRALAYVKERQQFGRRIAEFQATQHKLADMATKIELARLMTYKAAWNFDQGRIDPKLTSMAKMYAARTAVEVADEAIQLLGGYGYMTEYEVERFYRDAKITEIYEGTTEIQHLVIAGQLLKGAGASISELERNESSVVHRRSLPASDASSLSDRGLARIGEAGEWAMAKRAGDRVALGEPAIEIELLA